MKKLGKPPSAHAPLTASPEIVAFFADMIALADFAAGAMENWGLVTFRDNLVLFDPKKSSTQNEEAIATVVTHELGHQVSIGAFLSARYYLRRPPLSVVW